MTHHRITITIKTGGPGFAGDREANDVTTAIVSILHKITQDIPDDLMLLDGSILNDAYGNRVGVIHVAELGEEDIYHCGLPMLPPPKEPGR